MSPVVGGPWWRHAVCYQVYVRSFADADGDGLGDLAGITDRLPYLADLGVDAIWLTPFYPSPQHDHGYDVADYRDVDPRFGSLTDFDTLLGTAHDLGIRVIVDLVPNHTSVEHPWFTEALASSPDSPARDRYVFRDGLGPDGATPPNNWQSVFGGPAWTRIAEPDGTPGQWYLHLFDSSQPDLNWWNPEIGAEFESILRFWLDRGVDGFRVDVAHGLYTPADLADAPPTPGPANGFPLWDQPEVHEVYRRWRKILEEYDGERMAVAEAWTTSPQSMARYIRADELQQTFNFSWLEADWSARAFRAVVTDSLEAVGIVGASATWVLSNHDVVRHVTRYGGGARGRARGRAAVLTMLALPGSAYLYQGEELGLDEVDVAPEHRQDPGWLRGGDTCRDGSRVPIPWSGDAPPYGFGPGDGQPWLPQPADWAPLSVERQLADPDSTLSFYRRALAARRAHTAGLGDEVEVLQTADETLAFVRGGRLLCVLNCGTEPADLTAVLAAALKGPSRRSPSAPPGAMPAPLLSSAPMLDPLSLPPDTAAWFPLPSG